METRGDIGMKDLGNSSQYDVAKGQCPRDIAIYNYEKQPSKIKNRVNALKNIQLEAFKLEAEFYKELNNLELKYETMYTDLNLKRRNIYTGAVEPTKEECTLSFENQIEQMETVSNEMAGKLSVEEVRKEEMSTDVNLADGDQNIVGIPDFWHTIFKNVPLLNERMEEYDWPIIKYLIDISTVMINDMGPGFRLDFTFSPNEYFTNVTLSRSFYVNFELPEDNPLSYDGPEIIMSKGCKIDWKAGKNVTQKNIKQMKKTRVKGEKRTFTKTCRTNSFFNFFENIVSKNEQRNEDDPDVLNQIDSDFEIGQYLRERIIPRAVLFYTGEGIDDEEDDLEDECSESTDDSENDTESSSTEEMRKEHRSRLQQLNKES